MLPELQTYPLCLAVASGLGSAVALVYARRLGIASRPAALAIAVLTIAAFGGSKLQALLEREGVIGSLWFEAQAGYRFPGALIALIIALALMQKLGVNAALLGDAIAPSFGIGLVFARIGCLLTGCCYGSTTSLPWGITYPPGSPASEAHKAAGLLAGSGWSAKVHPFPIYLALLAFVAGALAVYCLSRRRYEGEAFVKFIALVGIGTYMLEWFRHSPLMQVQLMSLTIGLLASLFWISRSLGQNQKTLNRFVAHHPYRPDDHG